MSKRRDDKPKRERRSPTETVANVTDDFLEQLEIPKLPDSVPRRLEDALKARIEAFLFRLKEARSDRYAKPFEIRLVREAHRAVLTANELQIRDSEVYYAKFRKLLEEIGYSRVDVGYKRDPADP